MSASSNNHGRPPSARHQGRSNCRQAMSREALQQAHLHAAQELLVRQQRVASAGQYHHEAAYYPSAAIPNRRAYPTRSIHSPNGMELLPPGMPYHLNIDTQLSPSALLNHDHSRSCSIRSRSIPPQARTLHQAAIHHPLQHNPSMLSSRMTPQASLSMNGAVLQQQQQQQQPTTTSAAWWERNEEQRRQTYMYRDFAKDNKANKALVHQRSNYDQTFPVILYRVLSHPDFEDFISWLPHGRAFRIKKPEEVEEHVLPLYFRGTKISSFMRQVNGWGFRRMPTGPDRNSYYHEMFLRGLPHLCTKIQRPTTHKLKSSSDPKTHPNFYDTEALVALPDEEMDSIGSGSDHLTTPIGSIHDNQAQATLFPEEGIFTMGNHLYNSTEGSDQESSRLGGGKLNGSVVGTCSESGSNADASGSASEQGCGSDNGSSGGRSNTASPTNGGRISDGSDTASFERFAATVSRTNPSSGSDSGEAETTTSGGSSSARKNSETSRSNGRYGTHTSNGNSSDGSGSGSGSFLHLLTATALHAAALNEAHAPGFVMTGGNIGGDYSRDSSSSGGSDTGTEQVSDMSRRFSGGSLRTRARRQQTMDERLADLARKGNKSPESSGDGDCSNSDSRSNGRSSSDGADTSSFDKFDASLSQTRSRSSGSDSGGDAGTTSDASSSSARNKNSELSQPNGKSDTQSSNGNSSDGSFLHLLTETASRAAILAEPPQPPAAFVTTDSNTTGGDYSRDSSGSDTTGTEVVSRSWTASSSRGPPRKRAYYRQTSNYDNARCARKKNISSLVRYAQQDESSDCSSSSSDDHGRQR